MNDLKTVKKELAEKAASRAVELLKEHNNPLAVSYIITLEELARLEFRMQVLASATIVKRCGDAAEQLAVLTAIAEGKDLP